MKTEVLIVGAGPAGSTTAKILAEKNIQVILIDKDKFPRYKPCGGGLAFGILKQYPYIKNLKSIESYSYGGILHSANDTYQVKSVRKHPIVAMIKRENFDNELVNLAKDSGVKFLEKKQAKNIQIKQDSATTFLSDNTTIKSDIVIGADGFLSCIARKTGLLTSHTYKSVCLLEEFPVSPDILDEFYTEKRICHLHARTQGVYGYGWVFPKKDHINIGIGDYRFPDRNKHPIVNLKSAFDGYIRLLKKTGVVPKNLQSKNLHGGTLPGWFLKKTYDARVILIGDAAGFVNPINGEGIHYAMSSGVIAADVVADAIKKEQNNENFLSAYQRKWKQDFGKEFGSLLKGTSTWKDTDQFIRLLTYDKKLTDICFGIMIGEKQFNDHRFQLLQQYLIASLKKLLRKK